MNMTNQTLNIATLTCHDLHESIRTAKRGVMGDFSGGWQILAIDKDGERVTGDPVAYQERSNLPSLKLIRELAQTYSGQAVEIIVEGMGMALADWGNAAEQREHAEPTGDWWQVSISLDSLSN
jgi:hypothetical protein